MAQVTGQRWPIVGKRLVSEFPYIESEVTSAFTPLTSSFFVSTRPHVCFLSGAVRDERVRLHGHRRDRQADAFGLPERAGGRWSPASHRADHGERAGLERGEEDGLFSYFSLLRFCRFSDMHYPSQYLNPWWVFWSCYRVSSAISTQRRRSTPSVPSEKSLSVCVKEREWYESWTLNYFRILLLTQNMENSDSSSAQKQIFKTLLSSPVTYFSSLSNFCRFIVS